jgi:hypothetical protein
MKAIHHPGTGISRTLGTAALTMIIAMLTAACGGSGPATGSGSPAASAPSAFGQALTFARCARAHGLPNFPDPSSNGSFRNAPNDIPPSVVHACGHLISGMKQSHTAQSQQDYPKELDVARCVRAHGYPTFPDPPPPGSRAQSTGSPPGIDQNSPQFKAVLSSCTRHYFGSSTPPARNG